MTGEREPTATEHGFDRIFGGTPLMLILRGYGVERSRELAGAAWDLGIEVVEVPIQSRDDVETLETLVAEGAARGRLVGAGTVVSTALVETARAAGAAFTVSPGLDPEVVRASLAAGMPTLPGVATPTEIQAAQRLGLGWVKAFPASVLGAAWFSAMRGPFPDIRFAATGGIDSSNAGVLLDAGADVVAVGSAIASPEQLPALARLIEGR